MKTIYTLYRVNGFLIFLINIIYLVIGVTGSTVNIFVLLFIIENYSHLSISLDFSYRFKIFGKNI